MNFQYNQNICLRFSAILGSNLLIDLEAHPEYAFYCGSTHLFVEVTDLMNSPPIDPVPDNNIMGMPVLLLCQDGKYSTVLFLVPDCFDFLVNCDTVWGTLTRSIILTKILVLQRMLLSCIANS